ncbi:ComEA family DNA-binding protein [Chondromyces crocatus]|uniref:ComEA family DNA-binding protein n=1 Tax=Chondromyces crocatus TaxID=52 RepID=UPI0014704F84|nr:ComEA family DNA-binding protein [Chondromyces crocatus]
MIKLEHSDEGEPPAVDATASRHELWKRALGAIAQSTWLPVGARVVTGLVGVLALAMIGSGQAFFSIPVVGAAPSIPTTLAAGESEGRPTGEPSAQGDHAAELASAPTPGTPDGTVLDGGIADAEVPATAVLPDGRVVLNLASAEDLRRLPGIGPTKAAGILALRMKLKRFRKIEDLRRVKGIGRRSLERLRPLCVVDPP